MYFIKWTILVLSSLSGGRTLVVKNAIEVQVSGLALLVAYKVLATRLGYVTPQPCSAEVSRNHRRP
jgi:hypothetical protein